MLARGCSSASLWTVNKHNDKIQRLIHGIHIWLKYHKCHPDQIRIYTLS